MANITQEITEEMEMVYGRLGDAQVTALKKLIADEPAVRDLHICEIWQRVNRKLAVANFKPAPVAESSKSIMDNMFKSGDDYPDIFSSDPEDIDMDNYL